MGIRCSILDAGYWILDTGYSLSSFRSLRENRWKMEDRCAWKRGDEIWAFIFSSSFPRPSSLTPTFSISILPPSIFPFSSFVIRHSSFFSPSHLLIFLSSQFLSLQPPSFALPHAPCPLSHGRIDHFKHLLF